jgi:hypothetical protein
MINETTNFNCNVMVKEKNAEGVATGMETAVMYLSATLDSGNMNMNISANTVNKVLAQANAITVKAQYAEFKTAVEARAKELGYVIFSEVV